MEEVDKIIIHSLHQLKCDIGDNDFNLANFTPELLVTAVSACLFEIDPKIYENRSRSVPPGMAQRFTMATTLAEQCAAVGYRGDIGYQTFLYPNAVDVRRLLMYLIEHLPKDKSTSMESNSSRKPIEKHVGFRNQVKEKIRQELQAPWVPQYCRAVGNHRFTIFISQINTFSPQPNLNIPNHQQMKTKEMQSYMLQQAPNVFQQTAGDQYDLISSVIHKNALDFYPLAKSLEKITPDLSILAAVSLPGSTSATLKHQKASEKDENADKEKPTLSQTNKLNKHINTLTNAYDMLLNERKSRTTKIATMKTKQNNIRSEMEKLRKAMKMHERACVVLQTPENNIIKLENLIQSAQERRRTLETQWQTIRKPMVEQMQTLQITKRMNKLPNVITMRETIQQLEHELREKTASHMQLSNELKNSILTVAPRKEYTRRILEFIGNIRKQRNDIFKVLDDTRDLQKQLNSVVSQLQRQFNYTDDLLFQSAKHDLHAKKAYKLLAYLHSKCNELVELVSQIGNITKDIRDLEVQIDCEKLKNIGTSLQQITADINNFGTVIQNVQANIAQVENAITTAA